GGPQDTGVRAPGQGATRFTLPGTPVTPSDLVRAPAGLPSRLAENLYWLGRYQESCDDIGPLLRQTPSLKLQDSDDEENAQQPLQELARETGLISASDDAEQALLNAALS